MDILREREWFSRLNPTGQLPFLQAYGALACKEP